MMWWGTDHMGAGGWIGMGFMIVFWIAVVLGIIYLVRYLAVRPPVDRWPERPAQWQSPGPSGPGPGQPEALRILQERYARGEIDPEEFRRRKTDLVS